MLSFLNPLNLLAFLAMTYIGGTKLSASCSLPDAASLKAQQVWIEEHLQHLHQWRAGISPELKADILQMPWHIQDQAVQSLVPSLIEALQGGESNVFKKGEKNGFSLSDSSLDGPSLYIFVSLSMPEASLLQLGLDAKKVGGYLVIRGLKEGSFKKTVNALSKFIQKTGFGLWVDPLLFKKFAVQNVPTFVLAHPDPPCPMQQTCSLPVYDKLSGNVSLDYALSVFVREGETKEARTFLKHLRETRS